MYIQPYMKIITLTTDFGLTDGYPAAMKGVILSINPQINIIDITHSILPQNISQGAFILYSVVNYFPSAIHIGVVDPGVGTTRAGLVFKCGSGTLIGPDNGLLVPAAERLGIQAVYKITNVDYLLGNISSTFHGRDIFAPVAAHISKGAPLENVGDKVEKYVELNQFEVSETKNSISGKVLNIDNFGNIITNIQKRLIEKYFEIDDTLYIKVSSGKQKVLKIPYKTTYDAIARGELLATISSSGLLEIAGNQCNADEKLKIKISDIITIRKNAQ